MVGMARERSTRCKNKMIRDFAGTTIFDIYLNKLIDISTMDNCPFKDTIIAVNKNDKILWEKTSSAKAIKLQERSDSSVAPDSVLSSNFSFLEDYDENYVMWINGCFPFLKTETVISAAKLFINNAKLKSLHCVKQVKNWFWDGNGKPMTIRDKTLSRTQHAIPLFESVHCFHIFNRKYLLENCAYWDFTENNPYLHKVDAGIEFLDIDTELDFLICENLWRHVNENRKS